MEFKFDHVHLVCKDVNGMVNFFERIFDAKRISYSADFKGSPSAVIKLGDMRIFVRGLRPGEKPDAVAPKRRPIPLNIPAPFQSLDATQTG